MSESTTGITHVTDEADARATVGRPADLPSEPPFIRHTTHPCLSPDGTLLAYVVVERDGFPFAVQRPLATDGLSDSGGLTDISHERPVRIPVDGPADKVLYSPDGRWLAVEVAPDGGEREQIWLVTTDPDDDAAYPVNLPDDATVSIVCWDRDRLAVSAYDADGVAEGRLVDPETGEYSVIDRRMGGALVHARDGAALFRVGARGQRELLRILPDGRWRPLLPVDTGSTTDAGFVLTTSDEQGRMRMLVRSDHTEDRLRLLEVRSGEGQTEAWDLAVRADADLDRFEVSLDCSTAVLMWNVDGRTQVELLDLTSTPPRTLDRPRLPTLVARSPSLTADGGLLALTVEAPEMPPRVVVYDIRRGRWVGAEHDADVVDDDGADRWGRFISKLRPLTRTAARPVPPALPDAVAEGEEPIVPELVSYLTRDGLGVTGWLYRADDNGPAPTVVFLHGGPEGQSRPGYNDIAMNCVRAGFNYFMPNVRGSSGSGRFFVHADDRYGRFAAIDDVEDGLLHLIHSGITDPDKAIVCGRSYGGYLTLATLARHAGRWRGGIAACGMSDLETFYRDTEAWIAAAAYPKYGNPVQERELLHELSPIHYLDRVHVPVLFVHGAHDTNVPLSESEQAAAILSERGVSVDMLLFDDEGHEFVKLANRRMLVDRFVSFCQEVFDVRSEEE